MSKRNARPLERGDYVKAVSGHFEGKTGWVARADETSACVCWKGGWEHGIWESSYHLERVGRDKKHRKSEQD